MSNLPALQINEEEIFRVLSNSLYVGAQPESIKMVLSYCKASGLDPMLKPVHIVPMYCSTGKKDGKGYDIKAMRDVIMPGIGLYRIQASISKQYAGASEPEFGEDITEEIEGSKVTYPKWCKVTVKRQLESGVIAGFSAIEFWKENYATKSKDSKLPNAMWAKRPYGQIAKCAEAQALRKAFPEFGSQPTADEMEGKEIDVTPTGNTNQIEHKELPEYPDDRFKEKLSGWVQAITSNKQTAEQLINTISTRYTLSEVQKQSIINIGLENANS